MPRLSFTKSNKPLLASGLNFPLHRVQHDLPGRRCALPHVQLGPIGPCAELCETHSGYGATDYQDHHGVVQVGFRENIIHCFDMAFHLFKYVKLVQFLGFALLVFVLKKKSEAQEKSKMNNELNRLSLFSFEKQATSYQ